MFNGAKKPAVRDTFGKPTMVGPMAINESANLTVLRDTLLSYLISRKLEVKS